MKNNSKIRGFSGDVFKGTKIFFFVNQVQSLEDIYCMSMILVLQISYPYSTFANGQTYANKDRQTNKQTYYMLYIIHLQQIRINYMFYKVSIFTLFSAKKNNLSLSFFSLWIQSLNFRLEQKISYLFEIRKIYHFMYLLSDLYRHLY